MAQIRRLAAVALAASLLSACTEQAAAPSGLPAVPSATGDGARRPLVGSHYFGNAWPVNFIAGFRRADVPGDFRRLADDGFNSVVLVVSWGDFQPVTSPCCQYDERAWERLHFLLEQARIAKLRVVLRVGYAWSYHPLAGDSSERAHALMNQPQARAAYLRFVQRLARETGDKPQVVLTFMTWEDQWLRRIDDDARGDFRQFAASRTDAASFLAPQAELPTPTGDHAALFNAYWDWLVIEKIYKPAAAELPSLSYEARIDKEPNYVTSPDGARRIDRWLGHEGMLRQRPGHPVTIYWAPFWGAQNDGEKLSAERSLVLLQALLTEVRGNTAGQPLYIDQFNVVDNTLGHERNAVIASDQIPAFLDGAVCTLKANDVLGYAFWTGRDYAESPVFNPAFGYGLDGWTWQGAGDGTEALEAMPIGDFRLRLRAGDGISQVITPRRGRVPQADARPDRTCVTADVARPSQLSVRAGAGAAVALDFPKAGRQTQCAPIAPAPVADALDLHLQLQGGELALLDVQLFDHVQVGDIYGRDGKPGPLRDAVRRMNGDFRAPVMPARCDVATPDG